MGIVRELLETLEESRRKRGHGKEPCMTAMLIVDDLLQSHWAHKLNLDWYSKKEAVSMANGILRKLKKQGKLAASEGISADGRDALCYEPAGR